MASVLLLPDPAVLTLLSVEVNEETKMITATAKTTGNVANCPVCGYAADRVHSHYVRILGDLPCSGRRVHWLVQVRRFWCENTAHKVVDVLPDREAETVIKWLLEHPGVQVISRDRAGAYAEAARKGLLTPGRSVIASTCW